MDARIIAAMMLIGTLAIGCDTGKHDSTSMGEETAGIDATQWEASPLPARSGTVIIGETRYNFDIRLCSIHQPTSMGRFMITGQGTTDDGRPFTVHADGGTEAAAVVVRILGRYNSPVASYAARLDPSLVRIEDRLVHGAGSFGRLGQPHQNGQFSARCADRGATMEEEQSVEA
ncbi:hypothetical protein CAI21_15325 [Alkalilimnicola ehrlichii]|uniref:Lipoprotein n=1 Tax=Alkalilimnicola ehrlichii TaxID=351052 RepID=A0A3E0WSM4_9GAMM|nr:hypothetical protein [Alkalilimnicola ehrlichii]RFA27216.1 hypothetical protein CAI21_15325 [Alkalilimnicola ehrlichii]RFA35389.1 hypothetical protein CAL65_12990 [Alkalilimnicola ehrlichii]